MHFEHVQWRNPGHFLHNQTLLLLRKLLGMKEKIIIQGKS